MLTSSLPACLYSSQKSNALYSNKFLFYNFQIIKMLRFALVLSAVVGLSYSVNLSRGGGVGGIPQTLPAQDVNNPSWRGNQGGQNRLGGSGGYGQGGQNRLGGSGYGQGGQNILGGSGYGQGGQNRVGGSGYGQGGGLGGLRAIQGGQGNFGGPRNIQGGQISSGGSTYNLGGNNKFGQFRGIQIQGRQYQ